HATFGERPRNQRGIESIADFRLPDYRRDPPFAVRPASLAPARSVDHRAGISIAVNRLEATFAMLFDEKAHLFDGLPDFGRFGPATPVDPSGERPRRRIAHLAFSPWHQAECDGQLACRRNQSKP